VSDLLPSSTLPIRAGSVAQRPLSLGSRIAVTAMVAVAVVFVALPIVAIFARTTPASFAQELRSAAVLDALRVSLVTTLVAHAIVLLVGTPVAYVLARRSFVGRGLVIGLLELPIVLPPAVAGIGLLAAFGRAGLLGSQLAAFGISIPFTATAVVIASLFVSGPLYIRQAISAFATIDGDVLDAAQTLGASPLRTFAVVAVPLAMPGLEAGSALALARGFGEFGATIMFAGSLQGVTQTLPLAVYALLDTDFEGALAASIVLIMFGVAILIGNKVVSAWTRSRLT
jgi:molybdate transport system permease protein